MVDFDDTDFVDAARCDKEILSVFRDIHIADDASAGRYGRCLEFVGLGVETNDGVRLDAGLAVPDNAVRCDRDPIRLRAGTSVRRPFLNLARRWIDPAKIAACVIRIVNAIVLGYGEPPGKDRNFKPCGASINRLVRARRGSLRTSLKFLYVSERVSVGLGFAVVALFRGARMVARKGGHKLTPFKPGMCVPYDWSSFPQPPLDSGQRRCTSATERDGDNNSVLTVEAQTLDGIAANFRVDDRPVVNKTGITGLFSFRLVSKGGEPGGAPPFMDAIQDQLGLELRPAKGLRDFLVIDHIERPSPN